MLRIGGSPADFMVYDVFEGACSAANLNKTQPTLGPDGKPHGYFCPIWDQVPGQCLTMDRWAEINGPIFTSTLLHALWYQFLTSESHVNYLTPVVRTLRTERRAAHRVRSQRLLGTVRTRRGAEL